MCFNSNRLALSRERHNRPRTHLDELRMQVVDPTTRPGLDWMNSVKASANRAASDLWDLEHPEVYRDPDHFGLNILPGIAPSPIRIIAPAIGTEDAARRTRSGTLIPHPRHGSRLEEIGV